MRRSVLVYFVGFTDTIGGSEPLPLLVIKTLQEDYDCAVTLAMSYPSDIGLACSQYGIELNLENLSVVVLREQNPFRRLFGKILGCEQEMVLRRLGRKYDVCISCHGPKDFGRPATHFIHMLWSFDRKFAIELGVRKDDRFSYAWAKREVREFLRRIFFPSLRTGVDVLKDRNEKCHPNSHYVKDVLERRYQCKIAEVFYPPTLFEGVAQEYGRDKNVAYLGRIHPEKHIDFIVDVLAQVRIKTGQDVHFFCAGAFPTEAAAVSLVERLRACPWVHFLGPVVGEEKSRFLAAHAFAIHALKEEAFGISITEYLKSGVVPIVPSVGGPAEIVNDQDLTYDSESECVNILSSLLTDRTRYEEKYIICRKRGESFSREMYMRQHKDALRRIMEAG